MRILIVEDDVETADFIATGLRSRGHEPSLAASGREGFAAATAQTFDVIILDRMLPGLDGLSACRPPSRRTDFDPGPLPDKSVRGGRSCRGARRRRRRLSRQAFRVRGTRRAPSRARAPADPGVLADRSLGRRPRSRSRSAHGPPRRRDNRTPAARIPSARSPDAWRRAARYAQDAPRSRFGDFTSIRARTSSKPISAA